MSLLHPLLRSYHLEMQIGLKQLYHSVYLLTIVALYNILFCVYYLTAPFACHTTTPVPPPAPIEESWQKRANLDRAKPRRSGFVTERMSISFSLNFCVYYLTAPFTRHTTIPAPPPAVVEESRQKRATCDRGKPCHSGFIRIIALANICTISYCCNHHSLCSTLHSLHFRVPIPPEPKEDEVGSTAPLLFVLSVGNAILPGVEDSIGTRGGSIRSSTGGGSRTIRPPVGEIVCRGVEKVGLSVMAGLFVGTIIIGLSIFAASKASPLHLFFLCSSGTVTAIRCVPAPGNPKCDKNFKFLCVSYVTYISMHFLLCQDIMPDNLAYSSQTKNCVAFRWPFSPWRFWSQICNNQTIVALDGIMWM